MQHDPIDHVLKSAPTSAQFGPKFKTTVARAANSPVRVRKAGWDRIAPVLIQARDEVQLATDQVIRKVLHHNPDCVRIIGDPRSNISFGLFCYLPLNQRGAMAIVSGGLSGLDPDLDYICKKGETPAAIYFWLVYAPGKLARSVKAIADTLHQIAPDGCPIFSRAVNDHARRLNQSIGFVSAREYYPTAPEWLIVTKQDHKVADRKGAGPTIEVRAVGDMEDLAKVFAIRSSTYLADQYCLYSEEFDRNDFCATQLLGEIDGEPAGCCRVRYFADFAKVERLAVREQYRNSKLAFRLARAAMEHCRRKGYRTVYGHSRADLVRFWQIFGFRVMEGRPAISYANIEYREMMAEIEPHPEAIQTTSIDPHVILRPEGEWDDLGPLELSIAAASAETRAAIDAKMRSVHG